MMLKTKLLFILVVCSMLLHAQTPQTIIPLKGVVYDSLNNTPLANATVQLKYSKATGITTANGTFVLPISVPSDILIVS
ncbi:MAG TPA: hypothetical protein VG603_06140, partial [Chitinophagales bacterium]|nr:hypothetical protein [Chitinophagales bacterium]